MVRALKGNILFLTSSHGLQHDLGFELELDPVGV